MFSGLDSPMHWLVLAVVVLIVFGPKRLPELGRSLGSGIRGFRESLSGADEPDEPAEADDVEAAPDTPPHSTPR